MTPTHDPEFRGRYEAARQRARDLSDRLAGPGLFELFATLPDEARAAIEAQLTERDFEQLRYDWSAWARPKQDPPTDSGHRILFWLGGRGGGKTVSGSNRIRRRVEMGARSIALVGPTVTDIERYQIEGDGGSDGILTCFPPHLRPVYKAHEAQVFFHRPACPGAPVCRNAAQCGGAVAYVNSAEQPELRGPNLDTVWFDEPAKARYLARLWANIELSTRLRGRIPIEIILTGTPRPLQLFRELVADRDTLTVLLPQKENAANLDPRYVERMQRKLGGTRKGLEELEGEILDDNPGALFRASQLDAYRVAAAPELVETAVACDPGIATNVENDPTGIIGGGRDAAGHIYIMLDETQLAKPEVWGRAVIGAIERVEGDTVVGERNRGGDLVEANVRAAKERKRGTLAAAALKFVNVLATRGKAIRAEPVATLVEKGMVHLVGSLPELEAELTEWDPTLGGPSPNRLDAFVWLVWYLARLGEEEKPDPRVGFTGLREATARLQAPVAASGQGSAVNLAALLPQSGWGTRL